jgi:hypothetical protein
MNKKYKLIWSYLLVLISINITILVNNNINRHENDLPKIIQDINAGVVGAILTTIITLLLLNNQNETQENQLKNSVIYEEKLKLFNNFLNVLNKSMEDGNLTSAEMKNIIFNYSVIRIHISKESAHEIETIIQSINEEFFYVDENYIPRFDVVISFYTNICNVLRRELYTNQNNTSLHHYNLPNFSNIAFKKRALKLTIHKIEDAVDYYYKNRQIFYEDKEGYKLQFVLTKESIANLSVAYFMIKEILGELQIENFEERYLLNQYEINNKKYLGLFNVYYMYQNKQFATFGVSQKNRLYFKIKLEKESVFAFEPDTNVIEYKNNIKKDLSQYFSAQNNLQKKE